MNGKPFSWGAWAKMAEQVAMQIIKERHFLSENWFGAMGIQG
jgi:hypothetical protein